MPGIMLKALHSFPHLIIKFNVFAHTLMQQISNVAGRAPGNGDTGTKTQPPPFRARGQRLTRTLYLEHNEAGLEDGLEVLRTHRVQLTKSQKASKMRLARAGGDTKAWPSRREQRRLWHSEA